RAEPVRVGGELADLGQVVLVLRALARAGAALHPEDEQHDDQDPERDQPREPRRRWNTTAPGTLRRGTAGGALRPGSPSLRRALARLRLVEEVEFDVGVVLAHGATAGRDRKITLAILFARERTCFARAGVSPVGANCRGGCLGRPRTLRPAAWS